MKPVCKINKNGTKAWYLNGEPHREDGPAIELADGYKAWYLNGKLHRENGPAIEWVGTKEWFLNGQRHRVDGPAIEWPDGYKAWYLKGKKITEELHTKLTQGSIKNLPLYLESGCDEYIAERLRNETCL